MACAKNLQRIHRSLVKVTDRHYWNHKPFYTLEHSQIEGQYWRYPEAAFELPEEINELKESVSDEKIDLKSDIGGRDLNIQFDVKALHFEAKWRALRSYLRKRRIASTYRPEIIAEPINPT